MQRESPIDAKTYAEVLRLHSEHLRTLINRLVPGLAVLAQAIVFHSTLTTTDTERMSELDNLSQQIVNETEVLRTRIHQFQEALKSAKVDK